MRFGTLVLGWLAAGLLVAGVALGLLPIGDCGSAFAGDPSAAGATCDQLRAAARELPVLLIILGASLGGAWVTAKGSLGDEVSTRVEETSPEQG